MRRGIRGVRIGVPSTSLVSAARAASGPLRRRYRASSPTHITPCDADKGQCAGRVDVIEYLGADTFVVVDCGRLGALMVRVTGDVAMEHGAGVGLAFAQDHCHFFDRRGHRVDV